MMKMLMMMVVVMVMMIMIMMMTADDDDDYDDDHNNNNAIMMMMVVASGDHDNGHDHHGNGDSDGDASNANDDPHNGKMSLPLLLLARWSPGPASQQCSAWCPLGCHRTSTLQEGRVFVFCNKTFGSQCVQGFSPKVHAGKGSFDLDDTQVISAQWSWWDGANDFHWLSDRWMDTWMNGWVRVITLQVFHLGWPTAPCPPPASVSLSSFSCCSLDPGTAPRLAGTSE